ncbi:MAG TPA: hypothetical protein VGE39_10030 [Prosthecobacter sp.]
MKKIFTLLAMATSFAVMAPSASQARDDHHHRHGPSGRSFWHNCSVCGGPLYRERVYVGRDRHGHPIFDYRTAPHQHVFGRGRGHDHHNHGPVRGPGIFIPLPGRR